MGAAASESQGETARGSQEFSYIAEFFNIVRDHRAFPCSGRGKYLGWSKH